MGVWHDGAFWFCTGRSEQKHRNLSAAPGVTVTTGANTWQAGTDVIVEGNAERVTGLDTLVAVAAAYLEKYGEAWRFGRPTKASAARTTRAASPTCSASHPPRCWCSRRRRTDRPVQLPTHAPAALGRPLSDPPGVGEEPL